MKDSISEMCLDTTASNTGKKGAFEIIKQKLKRGLLAFAFRHHINEIIVAVVFDKCYNV